MKRSTYILGFILSFLAGISFVRQATNPDALLTQADSVEIIVENSAEIAAPDALRFQQISNNYMGSLLRFKSSGSKPSSADDCAKCGDVGDIGVYRSRELNRELNPAYTQRTLKAYCGNTDGEIVERGGKFNETGQRIGERCLTRYADGSASIFWTEGKEFWVITTTSSKLAKEFENSETFREWKTRNQAD